MRRLAALLRGRTAELGADPTPGGVREAEPPCEEVRFSYNIWLY